MSLGPLLLAAAQHPADDAVATALWDGFLGKVIEQRLRELSAEPRGGEAR